jgi:hypothetical protein
MKADSIFAALLFVAIVYYLVQRNLTHMGVWVGLVYLVASQGAGLSCTVSVIAGLVAVYVISMIAKREGFENEEKEPKKEKTPDPAPPKTSDPHVDVGTTILHAYRNLNPEQISGMRRDTKELMGLQKELMGSLSEMKPAIEQGAELLKTFSTFFGKPEEAVA